MSLKNLREDLTNLQNQAAYEYAKDLINQFEQLLHKYPQLKIEFFMTNNKSANQAYFAFHFDLKNVPSVKLSVSLHRSINFSEINPNIEPFLYEKLEYLHEYFIKESSNRIIFLMANCMTRNDYILEITQTTLEEDTKTILGINYPRYEREKLEQNLIQESILAKKNKI
jgi:hypothetical protein